MKPLPSERHLLAGVVGGSPSGLCPARKEGETRHFWKGSHTNHHPVTRQELRPYLPTPRAQPRCAHPWPQAAPPATCRKQAVEAELDRCKAKLRAVEAQLLEVLEEKLRLKQEVEAWEVGCECQPGLGGTGRWAQGLPRPCSPVPRRICSRW